MYYKKTLIFSTSENYLNSSSVVTPMPEQKSKRVRQPTEKAMSSDKRYPRPRPPKTKPTMSGKKSKKRAKSSSEESSDGSNGHSEDEHTCTKKRKHRQKAKQSHRESFRHASDSEDLDVPMDGIVEGVGSSKDGSMVQKVVDAGRHDAGADCAGENEDDEVRAVILA